MKYHSSFKEDTSSLCLYYKSDISKSHSIVELIDIKKNN